MVRRKTTAKPKRLKGKRMYKKRGYRKRSNFAKITHLPLGQSQKVHHRYIETFQLSTTLGAPGIYSFRVNDLYDPNFTGTGHQSIGFDQMSAVFDWFTVVGAKIRVRAYNRDSDEFVGVGLYFSEDSGAGGIDVRRFIENGAFQYKIMGPVGSDLSNGRVHWLSANVGVKKFLKINNLLDYENTTGTTTNSPSKCVYCHVIVWQPDAGATSAGTSIYFEMDQIAIWRKPKTLALS